MKFKFLGVTWHFTWLPFSIFIIWGMFSCFGLLVVFDMGIGAIIGYLVSTALFLSLAPTMDEYLKKLTKD